MIPKTCKSYLSSTRTGHWTLRTSIWHIYNLTYVWCRCFSCFSTQREKTSLHLAKWSASSASSGSSEFKLRKDIMFQLWNWLWSLTLACIALKQFGQNTSASVKLKSTVIKVVAIKTSKVISIAENRIMYTRHTRLSMALLSIQRTHSRNSKSFTLDRSGREWKDSQNVIRTIKLSAGLLTKTEHESD